MSDRLLSSLAAVAALVAGVVMAATQTVISLRQVEWRGDPPPGAPETMLVVLLIGTFLGVGGLLAARRPRQPVGWLILAIGLAGTSSSAGGLVHGTAGDPILRSFGAWLDAGLWHPSFPALGLLFLLFPTGTPPTPRWNWLVRSLVSAWVFLIVTAPFTTPDLLLEFYPDASPVIAGPWSGPLGPAHDLVQFAVFPLLLAGAASMVVRAMRSVGLERQQMKWFAASVVTIAIIFPISLAVVGDGSIGAPFFVLLPISCGVAILRFRLYDIDRLVSRTVTYALVVGVLVSVYAGGVFLIRSILSFEGDLAVAASTLAVAALFNPLRRRVQTMVDRRFYRSRYDARHTLEEFGAHLRDEVDLDALAAQLRIAVKETMHPTHVGLWLVAEERR